MMDSRTIRVGVLWPGDPAETVPQPSSTRLHRVFEEIAANDAEAVPVVYHDDVAPAVREQLLTLHGVLVWVDPIVDGRKRSVLDAMLRDVASQGVCVSAHPDVILKMGTKDVLYRTRAMGWGSDTELYATLERLAAELPERLRTGPRVLKQHRGNGGNGVWKVERADTEGYVFVQHALRGSERRRLPLSEWLDQCAVYFENAGCLIDQPYQPRLAEGMIRSYLVEDRVAGFGQQMVTALLPPAPGASGPPDPEPRRYYGPDQPEFQRLRALMETTWVPEMLHTLDLKAADLPIVWDADFLLGPRDADGQDTYVLCEINVSSVFPIPDEAPALLARRAVARIRSALR